MKVEFKNTAFIEWAMGREQVRKARAAGLPRQQWTNNPVFAGFRFCNVSREDDRGTLVIKRLIRDPMSKAASPQELMRAVAIARFFNLPRTIEALVEREAITDRRVDLPAIARIVEELRQSAPAFSSAYMVGSHPSLVVPPFDQVGGKIGYVCSIVHNARFPEGAKTRREFVHALRKETGFKDFMAGQIAADLAYTPILEDATDHQTWAPFGPGARRGMNLALGRYLESPLTEEEYLAVGAAQMEALPQEIVEDRRLTMHDVASNVNCETFKYERIKAHGSVGSRRFKEDNGPLPTGE